ncbi:MAG TPA: hypothetical protein PKH09_14650, partial [Parvularculaceae bacterium]|nr:hypothetical protein [Parvularculaceae bacterium]
IALHAVGFAADWAPVIRLSVDILIGVILFGATHIALWSLENRPDGVERLTLSFAQSMLRRRGARR